MVFKNRPAMQQSQDETDHSSGKSKTTGIRVEDKQQMYQVRDAIQARILGDYEENLGAKSAKDLHKMIEEYYNQYLIDNNLILPKATRTDMVAWITSDLLSYGPLDPLLSDPEITEIMVNDATHIYAEKAGRLVRVNTAFENNEHIARIIDRIVAPIGRRVDESSPMVDARLPNGYRVNATIPPLALDGPTLTIRKFSENPFTADDLINNNSLTRQAVDFLIACVQARINIIISGGTGSGKTTLLNVLSSYCGEEERIITIEDTAELQLNQEHVVRLEKRPANVEGSGEITIRQLVVNALRMRPDRIIVGESRGGEALDMLQAMNTGHDGSMTTVHSNSARDGLRRIETMVLMAGIELPLRAIRDQIASAIDLVVHIDRLRDGSRRVTQVVEVKTLEGDNIMFNELYRFEARGMEGDRMRGSLIPTGTKPFFNEKLQLNNIVLPPELFQKQDQ
jgi:pilus assembly protein CpaF